LGYNENMKISKSGPDDLKKAYGAGTAAVTGLATAVNPLLGIAFGMAAAYFGPAIERRQDRAEELIRYIQDNISEYTPEILGDKVFQDGLILLLEKYIRERNDDKRLILQKVLQGYIKAPNLLDYPLEEMTDLVSRLRLSDVDTLRKALQEAKIASEGMGVKAYDNESPFLLKVEPYSVSRLVYFGLLHEDRTRNGARISEENEAYYLYVWVSPTGKEFAKYINNSPVNSSS